MVDLYSPKLRVLQRIGESARAAFDVYTAPELPAEFAGKLREPKLWRTTAEDAWRKCRHAEQYIAATAPPDLS